MKGSIWVSFIIAALYLDFCTSSAVFFDIGNSAGLFGQLTAEDVTVKLSTKLKAVTDPTASNSGRICGFHVIPDEGKYIPFNADLVDPQEGIGEIRVRTDAHIDFERDNSYIFDLEAYDCDNPPHSSQRVRVYVTQVRKKQALAFTSSTYECSVVQYSRVGSVCDKVTVINAPVGSQANGQVGCGYSIVSGDLVPFTVDSQGVIRTLKVLDADAPKSFTFSVQYADCSSSPVHYVQALVHISVIQRTCEAAWQGLPPSVEYSPADNRPSRLLWSSPLTLNTCQGRCSSTNLSIQLKIRSADPSIPLVFANAANCRHDPVSLEQQRVLCGVNPSTSLNLLPDSTVNIERQVTQTQFGGLPELLPISFASRFSPSAKTSWTVNPVPLLMAIKAQQAADSRNAFLTEPLPRNIFERHFTLRFWLQRQPRVANGDAFSEVYETILCSQEDSPNSERALSVSFSGCSIVIKMTTREGSTNQLDHRSFRTLVFPELPDTICLRGSASDEQWHHYAISVSLDQTTTEILSSNLMVDGIVVGSLEEPNQPRKFTRPMQQHFPQIITVGSCFNTLTRQVEQVLDGALAGLTLVLGQEEDKGLSWCLAKCGETLLLPNSNELLKSGGSVYLDVDSILIKANSVTQAANLLRNVAYANPQLGSGQSNFNLLNLPDRLLEISTNYTCDEDKIINISVARIPLTIQPNIEKTGGIEAAELPSTSLWFPKAEVELQLPIPSSDESHASSQSQPLDVSPLTLAISGTNTITADVPVSEPGLPMFPGLKFVIANFPDDHVTAQRVASSVILDECLVIPISGGVLNVTAGEQIIWPVGRVNLLGITGVSDSHGIRLNGRLTAGQYASLLHAFRYWPPIEITRRKDEAFLENGVVWSPKFELICFYEHSTENTEPFIAKIIIRSPELAEEAKRANLDASFGESPVHRFDVPGSPDDDVEYVEYDYGSELQRDAPAPEVVRLNAVSDTQKLGPSSAYLESSHQDKSIHFAALKEELSVANSPQLEPASKGLQEMKSHPINLLGLTVTLSLFCFVVMLLGVVFFLRNRSFVQRFRPAGFNRKIKSGGRLQLRPEAQLNVTENPIEKLEAGISDWKSEYPAAYAESLPNVHSSPLRSLPLQDPNQLASDEDQFDAETRSFDGLFEEDYIEGVDLEEVDDFDESPVHSAQSTVVTKGRFQSGLLEVDEEFASDQDTCGETGPIQGGLNHLQFLTLPKNRLNASQLPDPNFTNI